jgi:hypothetical protein
MIEKDTVPCCSVIANQVHLLPQPGDDCLKVATVFLIDVR